MARHGNRWRAFQLGIGKWSLMVAERLEGYDYLAIFDISRIQEIPEIRNAVPAPALASAPAPDFIHRRSAN